SASSRARRTGRSRASPSSRPSSPPSPSLRRRRRSDMEDLLTRRDLLVTAGERVRASLALSAILVGFGGLAGRLYDIQVKGHERYSTLARKQHQRVRPILPWRGDLLALEDGRAVVIASSLARG